MTRKPGSMYREIRGQAYARKEYMGGVPNIRISQFDIGDPRTKFPVKIHLVAAEACQIRHIALEAARIAANRYIAKKAGNAYHLKLRLYPHNVLRENKIATGAGADRISEGMRAAFGAPVGTAARVKPGTKVFTISTTEDHVDNAKNARTPRDILFRASACLSRTMGETDRLLEVIRGRNSKTVGLQFPVGLRTKAVELAQEIEAKAGVTCLVSADPSFGACDVADMPVDLIVHLGHAPMPHLRYNRVFFYDLPGPPLGSMTFIDAAEPMLPKRVGLLTTTQFRHWLPAIQAHLEKKGHVVRIGEPDRRVAYAGQLLGCDYHTATVVQSDVDGYLYVGTGDFHPLGVAILVDKPVIIADPERGTASSDSAMPRSSAPTTRASSGSSSRRRPARRGWTWRRT